MSRKNNRDQKLLDVWGVDWWIGLALAYTPVQSTLTQNVGLAKKSAHWVAKLLSTAQKEEWVKCCNKFLQLLWQQLLAVLDNIVTMKSLQFPFTPRRQSSSPCSWWRNASQGQLRSESMLQGQSRWWSSPLMPNALSIPSASPMMEPSTPYT